MIKIPFFEKKQKLIGVDVGTTSTRIVHLSYFKKGKAILENYGEKFNEIKKEELCKTIRKKTFPYSREEIAEDIKGILIKTKIAEKRAIFSIPDFMTFFTVFRIPFMPKEEMDSAVYFEAKQHIPLPLKEVSLDWSITEEGNKETKQGPKIILVAVPNKVVEEYKKIAKLAGIELLAIEAEIFSLVRASIIAEDKDKVIQLIDVGVQSTTISIVKNGMVKSVFSINFSESEMIKNLAEKLGISYNEVEEIKNSACFVESSNEGKVMCSQLDILVGEANRVSDNFVRMGKKEVDKVILAGGITSMPGFRDYFEKKIKKETSIINPFSDISYPPTLEKTIKEIGPRYAIAVGLALRNKK